jgi:hypothetical protein
MDSVRRGVKEFLLKYSSPTSLSPKAPSLDHFTTVLSIHKGSEAETFIKDYLSEKEWFGRLIIVTDEGNEHLNAMSAADLGISYDGAIIGAAAACHLPTMVLFNMRMHHHWFHD